LSGQKAIGRHRDVDGTRVEAASLPLFDGSPDPGGRRRRHMNEDLRCTDTGGCQDGAVEHEMGQLSD
jgi:hypothetical protein